jgi:hypothetical protein
MNWRGAKNLLNELETIAKPYQKQDCWGLIERGSFGYDPDLEKDVYVKDLDKAEAAERRQKFLDSYTQSLFSLPD